ncbi:forkhead box protein J2-like [Acipenser ruthenus]|uniref:forkhead box protein J2-like n=1 Tax=Acipenser ruthenus TaxID=7906 RepID=UPI00155FE6DE|nr:forkhead box protein J2-like [Acipenser ruthenus]XP_034760427.1 forkhead box protein J2-like [Acipenser ruthenus]XP_058849559.1 forkhead box protein J2-like [Acipenser ruthenus]
MASNLSDSLTSMDWLPQLNLKGCVKSRSSELGAQTEKGARGTNKPPFSYATLISQAIKSTARGRMSLNDIYSWICEQYPYYKNTAAGWKNSIRHNLSLNKCFRKIPRPRDDPGKGSYWTIDSCPKEDPPLPRGKRPHPTDHEGSQDSLLEQEVTSSPSLGLQSESVRDERLWEGPPPSKVAPPPLSPFSLPQPPPPQPGRGEPPQSCPLRFSFTEMHLQDLLGSSFQSLYRTMKEKTGPPDTAPHSSRTSCMFEQATPLHTPTFPSDPPHPPPPSSSSTSSSSSSSSSSQDSAAPAQGPVQNNPPRTPLFTAGHAIPSDWFSSIDSLKESFKIANNLDWSTIDLTQFPDLLKSMQQADMSNWSLDPTLFTSLCDSLNQFFTQTGLIHSHHTLQPPQSGAANSHHTLQPPQSGAANSHHTLQPPQSGAANSHHTLQPPQSGAANSHHTLQPPQSGAANPHHTLQLLSSLSPSHNAVQQPLVGRAQTNAINEFLHSRDRAAHTLPGFPSQQALGHPSAATSSGTTVGSVPHSQAPPFPARPPKLRYTSNSEEIPDDFDWDLLLN